MLVLILIIFSLIRLWVKLWVREIVKSKFFIKLFHFLLPLFPQIYLSWVSVQHIEGQCTAGLALWYWIVFGALEALCLSLFVSRLWNWYFSCVFVCISLSVCWSCLWCSLSQSSSAFLQMGQFGPHPHLSGIDTVELEFHWPGSWGSAFITGGLGFVLLVVAVLAGRGNWPILPQFAEIARHFLSLRPGGTHTNRGIFQYCGLFSEVGGFWPSGSTGALAFAWGGCMVMLPGSGLATTFTLYFFVGINLFLFSVTLDSFLTWGLVSGRGDLNWLDCDWGFGPNFTSSSRYVFIFFMMVGWGWSLVLHRLHLISWHVLSLLNIWVPCTDVILTFTSTVSTGRQHKKAMQEIAFGLQDTDHLKIKCWE